LSPESHKVQLVLRAVPWR